jgi:hypothetical protein
MNFNKSFREKMALVILILFIFYSQRILIDHTFHFIFPRIEKDEITLYEERFSELKKLLPSHGIVGYVSDTSEGDLYKAQYVLAPVILNKFFGPRLIVANFSRASAMPNLLYGKPFKIIKNFNNGVALLSIETT